MNKCARRLLTATLAIATLAVPAALAGCSSLGDSLSGSYLVFENREEAMNTDVTDVPQWLPQDAERITLESHSDHDGHLLIFGSDSTLPAAVCAATDDHQAAPFDDWPDDSKIETRLQCDDFTVVRADGRWFAWSKS